MCKRIDFFLGAGAPTGFHSYFRQAYPSFEQGTVLLLKGSAGSGKSTILRALGQALCRRGLAVEYIHCASAPDSLDGIVCPALCLSAFDATAPHALEPEYPGAYEQVVPLYDAMDRTVLSAHRAELKALGDQYTLQTQRALRYLTAAGCLLQDSMRTARCCTDVVKAQNFAKTLAKRYLPQQQGPARENIRLLSAVTPDGPVFFSGTVRELADTIVVLDDAWGASGQALFSALRQQALERGLNFTTCYCPLDPGEKIEHLLFPSLRLAFVTSNPYHPLSFPGQRTLHAQRFTNQEALALRRNRLRFNQKAAQELLEQASAVMAGARGLHGRVEQIYAAAMDTARLDEIAEELIRQWV